MSTLIDKVRAKIATAAEERAASQAELDAVIEAVEVEGRSDLTDAETVKFNELRARIVEIDNSIGALQAREAELADVAERAAKAVTVAAPAPATGQAAVVRTEARTYTAETERRGVSFVRDVVSSRIDGDTDAAQRLARHRQEEIVERGSDLIESRAVGTGAFAGLTVPQYLTDMVAPIARAGRPFADICNSHALPASGMTVNISRITTGTSAAVQASENAAVSETNADDTLLTVNVRTIAGQQTISRQAVDRSTGADEVILSDLVRAYHTRLDYSILNDDGTSGTHLGVRNVSGNVAVTFTEATPTAAEMWPKLLDLVQQIQTGTFMAPDYFVMHPRRFWWIASNVGTNFPFIQLSGIQTQAGAVGSFGYGSGPSGVLAGIPVIVDANLPTDVGAGTEDTILGVVSAECHLWEDGGPLFIRAEQTSAAALGVLLVVYGYSAFTAGRYPLATGDITGTGLIAPTF